MNFWLTYDGKKNGITNMHHDVLRQCQSTIPHDLSMPLIAYPISSFLANVEAYPNVIHFTFPNAIKHLPQLITSRTPPPVRISNVRPKPTHNLHRQTS